MKGSRLTLARLSDLGLQSGLKVPIGLLNRKFQPNRGKSQQMNFHIVYKYFRERLRKTFRSRKIRIRLRRAILLTAKCLSNGVCKTETKRFMYSQCVPQKQAFTSQSCELSQTEKDLIVKNTRFMISTLVFSLQSDCANCQYSLGSRLDANLWQPSSTFYIILVKRRIPASAICQSSVYIQFITSFRGSTQFYIQSSSITSAMRMLSEVRELRSVQASSRNDRIFYLISFFVSSSVNLFQCWLRRGLRRTSTFLLRSRSAQTSSLRVCRQKSGESARCQRT